MKIFIEIRGGCLVSAYSDQFNMQCFVVDWDGEQVGDGIGVWEEQIYTVDSMMEDTQSAFENCLGE